MTVLLTVATATGATATAPSTGGSLLTDDGATNSGKDTHVHDAQHGTDLPPVQSHVDLVGFTDLFAGRGIDITNPSKPTWVAEYDLRSQSSQPTGAVHGDAVFIHDDVVKKIGNQYIGLLSYWDGGYCGVTTSTNRRRTAATCSHLLYHRRVDRNVPIGRVRHVKELIGAGKLADGLSSA